MALQLTVDEKAALDIVEVNAEDAFANGVEYPGGTQVIAPISHYNDPIMTASGSANKKATKAPFKAIVAALFKAFGALVPAPVQVGAGGAPAYENNYQGWTDPLFDQGAIFYKNPVTGMVRVEGMVRAPATAQNQVAIFTLPIGFRPARYKLFLVASSVTTTPGLCSVQVQADGKVFVVAGAIATGFVSLNGIEFRGEA